MIYWESHGILPVSGFDLRGGGYLLLVRSALVLSSALSAVLIFGRQIPCSSYGTCGAVLQISFEVGSIQIVPTYLAFAFSLTMLAIGNPARFDVASYRSLVYTHIAAFIFVIALQVFLRTSLEVQCIWCSIMASITTLQLAALLNIKITEKSVLPPKALTIRKTLSDALLCVITGILIALMISTPVSHSHSESLVPNTGSGRRVA